MCIQFLTMSPLLCLESTHSCLILLNLNTGTSCLSLHLVIWFQPTLGPHSRVVMHDIPVNVVPRRLWEEYQEPSVPQFDVSVAILQ